MLIHATTQPVPEDIGCSVNPAGALLPQELVKMAEGPRDQGSASAADLEDDSPNTIVYRKVSLTPSVFSIER